MISMPKIEKRHLWHGAAWMLLAEVLFSTMRVSTRYGARGLSWHEVAMVRFLGGAAVIAAVGSARGISLRVRNQRAAWMRSGFGTLSALGSFYALGSDRIAVGDVATISATTPMFVALLVGPLLGERVPRSVKWGIVLGFAGVAVLLQPSFRTSAPVALAAFLGAVAFAFAVIWMRRIAASESSESVALHFTLVAGCTMALITLPVFQMPTREQLPLLMIPALTGGLGQLAMTRAYALDDAARISAISFLGVFITYTLESLTLRRPLTTEQGIGAVRVCAAGVLVTGIMRRRVPDERRRTVPDDPPHPV
jgi:drug/metabolite transporter (DMT)-like permease